MLSEIVELEEACPHCGSQEWLHVEATPETMAGLECNGCGRGFIPDAEQPSIPYDQLSILDQEYLEYLREE